MEEVSVEFASVSRPSDGRSRISSPGATPTFLYHREHLAQQSVGENPRRRVRAPTFTDAASHEAVQMKPSDARKIHFSLHFTPGSPQKRISPAF